MRGGVDEDVPDVGKLELSGGAEDKRKDTPKRVFPFGTGSGA